MAKHKGYVLCGDAGCDHRKPVEEVMITRPRMTLPKSLAGWCALIVAVGGAVATIYTMLTWWDVRFGAGSLQPKVEALEAQTNFYLPASDFHEFEARFWQEKKDEDADRLQIKLSVAQIAQSVQDLKESSVRTK